MDEDLLERDGLPFHLPQSPPPLRDQPRDLLARVRPLPERDGKEADAAAFAAGLDLLHARDPREGLAHLLPGAAHLDGKPRAAADIADQVLGESIATILPRLMMMTRPQIASTSGRMCVERRMVYSPPSRLISERTWRTWLGSRPMVGSSRMRTFGSWTSASARPTRWR